ncbi:MAG: hypothetical protein ABSA18_06195 [Dehalococcoidia bacterium]
MSKKFRVVFMCIALVAILSAVLLAGCSSTSTSQTTAPAVQSQQQTTQPAQQQTTTSGQQPSGQRPSGQGQGQQNMQQVITKAAVILGVSATDLTTAFDAATKSAGGNRPSGSDNRTRPSGQPPQGGQQSGQQPSQGQSGQGQAPSGSSDMMKSVYTSIATTLNLTADKVQAAFEQAQSELKQ